MFSLNYPLTIIFPLTIFSGYRIKKKGLDENQVLFCFVCGRICARTLRAERLCKGKSDKEGRGAEEKRGKSTGLLHRN